MIVFGPVPSRRLGKSLGINNIPHKNCSYSCVYCQVGPTNYMSISRKEFYKPDHIYNEVEIKINQLKINNEKIDYITFVPDGEPTLDINLGVIIKKLKTFGYKIAVITNSSLISDKSIQDDLMQADLVSLKIDSTYSNIWHKINCPHGLLDLKLIKDGIKKFASDFKGTLVTETMLVSGYNDNSESLYETAVLISQLNPVKVYVLIPTRPPAEENIKSPKHEILRTARQIFSIINRNCEFIDYYEGSEFTFGTNPEEDLLSIVSVHPMRKDEVENLLTKANTNLNLIENLILKDKIREIQYNGKTYLTTNFRRNYA
jgi:wyosine [tRNA(Phe)-imidazoG37] synthetase (radical SAM superfamily)